MDRKAELPNPVESTITSPKRDFGAIISKARFMAPVLAMALALTAVAGSNAKADDGDFTTDQSRVVRTYFQCGGDGYLPEQTVLVQQVQKPDGFNSVALGVIAGNCGNRFMEPDSWIQDLAQVQTQQARSTPIAVMHDDGTHFAYARTFPQCGGSSGPMDINPEYTVIVDEFIHPETAAKAYAWRTVGRQPGQCGNP